LWGDSDTLRLWVVDCVFVFTAASLFRKTALSGGKFAWQKHGVKTTLDPGRGAPPGVDRDEGGGNVPALKGGAGHMERRKKRKG